MDTHAPNIKSFPHTCWSFCRAAVAAASAAVGTLSFAIPASAEDLMSSDSVRPADDFFLESVLITVLMYVVLMSVYVWVSELLAQVGFQWTLRSCAAIYNPRKEHSVKAVHVVAVSTSIEMVLCL